MKTVHTYDVFNVGPMTGNQLAVFTGLFGISDSNMQKLAKEMNYAESVFLGNEEDGIWPYRIFTPSEELPFAGHPTLGTAFHVMDNFLEGVSEVVLRCYAGDIPVHMQDGILWMNQQSASFGETVDPIYAARVLSLNLDAVDQRFPAQIVSTGIPFLILPLESVQALQNASHGGSALLDYCAEIGVKGIYAVTASGRDRTHQIAARSMIAEKAVPEDPATGSACGCFSAWALEHSYPESSDAKELIVGQGYEIGRPSLLFTDTRSDQIMIGGKVSLVIRGVLGPSLSMYLN
ncbi:MAG: trans-2,3-dihydro-3-hydroxyanthranilate isomerase [Chloroflexi bacterium]|jgi:trans-2,3-dihydro-3-hydroxyanthranilate isomerase|nr:MAG: trans-2,3-dihydro-3-hydroxyanthranilate isomerase [Chloroflexota bacterium]